jgi:uncharacterized delta-60 repeat protein
LYKIYIMKLPFVFLLLITPYILDAQNDGLLFQGFGLNGIHEILIGDEQLILRDAGETSDGKIIYLGSAADPDDNKVRSFSARLLANGMTDPDFTLKFLKIQNEETVGKSLAIQKDGKSVVCGWFNNGTNFDIFLMRQDLFGEIDLSFASGNLLQVFDFGSNDYGMVVGLDKDDNIFLCGRTNSPGTGNDIVLIKFDKNGNIISSFGNQGIVKMDFGANEIPYDMKIGEDGAIYLAVDSDKNGITKMAAVKCLNNGNPDSSFGTGGMSAHLVGKGFASTIDLDVDKNGNVILIGNDTPTGNNSSALAVVSLLSDGSLNTAFNNTGTLLQSVFSNVTYGTGITFTPDQNILTLGFGLHDISNNIVVQKMNTSGVADPDFADAGRAISDWGSNSEASVNLLLLKDGNILATGHSSIDKKLFFAKYRNTVVSSTNNTSTKELTVYPNPSSGKVNIMAEEKIQQLSVFDNTGKLIKTQSDLPAETFLELSKGQYIIVCRLTDQVKLKFLVIE